MTTAQTVIIGVLWLLIIAGGGATVWWYSD